MKMNTYMNCVTRSVAVGAVSLLSGINISHGAVYGYANNRGANIKEVNGGFCDQYGLMEKHFFKPLNNAGSDDTWVNFQGEPLVLANADLNNHIETSVPVGRRVMLIEHVKKDVDMKKMRKQMETLRGVSINIEKGTTTNKGCLLWPRYCALGVDGAADAIVGWVDYIDAEKSNISKERAKNRLENLHLSVYANPMEYKECSSKWNIILSKLNNMHSNFDVCIIIPAYTLHYKLFKASHTAEGVRYQNVYDFITGTLNNYSRLGNSYRLALGIEGGDDFALSNDKILKVGEEAVAGASQQVFLKRTFDRAKRDGLLNRLPVLFKAGYSKADSSDKKKYNWNDKMLSDLKDIYNCILMKEKQLYKSFFLL